MELPTEVLQKMIELTRQLDLLSKQLQDMNAKNVHLKGWIPKKDVLKLFDYGETQLRHIEPYLKCSKVGRRKFYQVASIEQLLTDHSNDK
jgi:hypothetical protein